MGRESSRRSGSEVFSRLVLLDVLHAAFSVRDLHAGDVAVMFGRHQLKGVAVRLVDVQLISTFRLRRFYCNTPFLMLNDNWWGKQVSPQPHQVGSNRLRTKTKLQPYYHQFLTYL